MKTFTLDIINKLKYFSKKLDEETLLINQHWIVLDEQNNNKLVYIFRSNGVLLISNNGLVDKGKWENLGNKSLLIDISNKSYLFRHGFFDDSVLALKIDGKNEYWILLNEVKFPKKLKNIEQLTLHLRNKYKIFENDYQKIEIKDDEQENISFNEEQDGPIILGENGKYGIFDDQFNNLTGFVFDFIEDFFEGLALFYIKTAQKFDKYGYLDNNGQIIIPSEYDYAENFQEGLAVVRLNNKFGFINKSNKMIISNIYENCDSFKDGKAKVNLNDKEFFIDCNGNEI